MALQYDYCAFVVAAGDTFRKCRIQNAQPLNGSGVAFTRARHVTP